MLYMNEYDIERAMRQFAEHPVLGPATQTLHNLAGWANRNSDGWAYWPKPCRAARKLQELIQHVPPGTNHWDTERADATEAAYRAALSPIKAFCTREKADVVLVPAKQPETQSQ